MSKLAELIKHIDYIIRYGAISYRIVCCISYCVSLFLEHSVQSMHVLPFSLVLSLNYICTHAAAMTVDLAASVFPHA